jgi:hypothetical protein
VIVEPLLILDSAEAWRPLPVEPSLAALGYTWDEDDGWRDDGGAPVERLDFPPEMTPSDFTELRPAGYRRIVPGGRLHWVQYWLWYPYNPKNYPPTRRGVGEHEGDWEVVQIGCKDATGTEPVLLTYSQHDGGEKREAWRAMEPPSVCIARDSHANYFEPMRNVTDTADGEGEILAPEWLDFGPWQTWPGVWGNSSNSPGPLHTRRAWTAPHEWHGQARG